MTSPVFNDAPQFKKGEIFHLDEAMAGRDEPWFNQALVTANESVLRVAKLHGEFHHHSHDTDELFYVLDGEMEIEVGGTWHRLSANMGITIPAGIVHRTRADAPATVLLVAAKDASMAGVTETGEDG